MQLRRARWPVALAVTGMVLGACNSPTSPAATSPAASAVASARAIPSRPASLPHLCSAGRPAQQDPFPYNRDYRSRDALLKSAESFPPMTGDMLYVGGAASFYGIDVDTVAELLTDRYVDPYEYQNEAPTIWEIFKFMCRYPQVQASGYVISIDRPDYRMLVDDISVDASTASQQEVLAFCADAETDMQDGGLECFWD
jgi:hypothetical protein